MGRAAGILYDCVPAACLALSVSALTVLSWQVTLALRAAHRVHAVQEAVVAALVAEDAAFDAVERLHAQGGEDAKPIAIQSPTGLLARLEAFEQQGRPTLRVAVDGRKGNTYLYECDLLAGAAPECLGNPLSVRHSVVAARQGLRQWLRRNLEVRLDPLENDTLARLFDADLDLEAGGPLQFDDFEEDRSIGLLRLTAGTDRPDHVPRFDRSGSWRPAIPESGVRTLTGNLWIDRGERPLQVELARSLTIFVKGNIYIGRSIEVRGPGRLILVALRGAEDSYVDRDGNGSWSAGDESLAAPPDTGPIYRGSVEGAGGIFLGLPGAGAGAVAGAVAASAPASSGAAAPPIDIEASLVSGAEVYVRAPIAVVQGALVVGEGITWTAGAELHLTGSDLPNIERERVPGFIRAGVPRPGLMVPVR